MVKQAATLNQIENIDTDLIYINDDFRTRNQKPTAADVKDLANSISGSPEGQIQPIGVRPYTGDQPHFKYELIWGEHRTLACKLLGIPVKAVIVKAETEADVITMQFMENNARRDLTPMDRLHACKQLETLGWSQKKIAQTMKRSVGWVSNILGLDKLPDEVKTMLAKGDVTQEIGILLLDCPEKVRVKIAEEGWGKPRIKEYLANLDDAPKTPGTRTKATKTGGQKTVPQIKAVCEAVAKADGDYTETLVPIGEVAALLLQYINGGKGVAETLFDRLVQKHKKK